MRSQDTEHRFNRELITYTYLERVPISSIVRTESEFQNRLTTVEEETIEEMAIGMAAGDDFPPIEVIERNGIYRLLNGHQRLRAADKCGRDWFDLYVLELTDDQAKEYAWWVNTAHGTRLPRADRVNYALAALDRAAGAEIAAIARKAELSEEWLRNEYRNRQVERRTQHLAIAPGITKNVNKKKQRKLHEIKQDRPFEEAIKFASDADLNDEEVAKLTNEVKNASSEEAAIEIVQQKRETLIADKRRDTITKQIKTVERAIGDITGLDPLQFVRQLSSEDRSRLQQLLARLSDWTSRFYAETQRHHAA
jgi:ParB-like chromosome segregation protein Spo0J